MLYYLIVYASIMYYIITIWHVTLYAYDALL